MIRINLAAPRPRPKVKRPVAIAGTLQLLFFLLAFGGAILVLAGHWWIIRGEITDLNQQIEEQRAEERRLGNLKKEVEAFEAKQRLLQGRIQVIENLQRNQAGPVRLLDAIGTTVSLTETVWLTSVEERSANEIEFQGRAASVEAVANFITNLKRSGYFENIEMKESAQAEKTPGPGRFEFTLTARFFLPAPPEGQTTGEGKS